MQELLVILSQLLTISMTHQMIFHVSLRMQQSVQIFQMNTFLQLKKHFLKPQRKVPTQDSLLLE